MGREGIRERKHIEVIFSKHHADQTREHGCWNEELLQELKSSRVKIVPVESMLMQQQNRSIHHMQSSEPSLIFMWFLTVAKAGHPSCSDKMIW